MTEEETWPMLYSGSLLRCVVWYNFVHFEILYNLHVGAGLWVCLSHRQQQSPTHWP